MLDYAAYLNVQEGLARIRGNQKVYITLLDSYSKKDLLAQLNEQLDEGSIAEAERTAHAIKGLAGNMSMPALYEAACALDAKLKEALDVSADMPAFNETAHKTNEALAYVLQKLTSGEEL